MHFPRMGCNNCFWTRWLRFQTSSSLTSFPFPFNISQIPQVRPLQSPQTRLGQTHGWVRGLCHPTRCRRRLHHGGTAAMWWERCPRFPNIEVGRSIWLARLPRRTLVWRLEEVCRWEFEVSSMVCLCQVWSSQMSLAWIFIIWYWLIILPPTAPSIIIGRFARWKMLTCAIPTKRHRLRNIRIWLSRH